MARMARADAATLGALLARARGALLAAGRTDPAGDARRLCEAACEASLADFVAHPDRPAPPGAEARLDRLVARRIAGEPVHRILGWRGFHGLTLTLSAETLEPRPDTEALVDLVLERFGGSTRPFRILDLGTGSGAIALALLCALPNARAIGSDIAPGALETARGNARANGLEARFETIHSRWFDAIEGVFDIIVSNPPYIRTGEIAGLPEEVRRYDPQAALDGGLDGLAAYRAIAAGARARLAADGYVAVEIGYDQKIDVVSIFRDAGFAPAGEAADLAGHDRALAFCNANKTLGIPAERG